MTHAPITSTSPPLAALHQHPWRWQLPAPQALVAPGRSARCRVGVTGPLFEEFAKHTPYRVKKQLTAVLIDAAEPDLVFPKRVRQARIDGNRDVE